MGRCSKGTTLPFISTDPQWKASSALVSTPVRAWPKGCILTQLWERQGRDCFTLGEWGKLHESAKKNRGLFSCTFESILIGNITSWYGNSTEQVRKALQRVVYSAEHAVLYPAWRIFTPSAAKIRPGESLKIPPTLILAFSPSWRWNKRYRIHQASA